MCQEPAVSHLSRTASIAFDEQLAAVVSGLRQAQQAASRGDYADALAWIQMVEATGDRVQDGFATKRRGWLSVLAELHADAGERAQPQLRRAHTLAIERSTADPYLAVDEPAADLTAACGVTREPARPAVPPAGRVARARAASRKRLATRAQAALPALPTPRIHPGIEYASESLIRRYHELAEFGTGSHPAAG